MNQLAKQALRKGLHDRAKAPRQSLVKLLHELDEMGLKAEANSLSRCINKLSEWIERP